MRIVLLLTATLAALVFAIIIPPAEAPDEPAHVTYALYLARSLEMPEAGISYELHQPPLYYFLTGIAATAAGISPQPLQLKEAKRRHSRTPARKFVSLEKTSPGSSWMFYTLRFASIALTVILAGISAKLFAGVSSAVPLVPAAIAAFVLNPQLLFICGTVNNDVLIIALCALATASLSVALLGSDDSKAQFRAAVTAGAAAGASIWVKSSWMILVPALCYAAWIFLHKDRRRPALMLLGLPIISFLLFVSWNLYVRGS